MANKTIAKNKYASILPQIVSGYDENGDRIIPGVTRIEQLYDDASFPVLKGLEAVRLRPGMYIGDVGTRGLHQLFKEVIDNSVDEVLAGHCTEIDVVLGDDYTLSVSDNGRGIAVDRNEESGMPCMELVLTELHIHLPFERFRGGGRVSSGLHSVGLSTVNALSGWLVCEVRQAGKIHRIRFERGVLVTPLEVIGDCDMEEQGTAITWLADKTVFKPALTGAGDLAYDGELLANRCRELAYHLPTARITFHDRLHGRPVETFCYPNGVADYVSDLNRGCAVFPGKPILLTGAIGEARVAVAVQCNDTGVEKIISFANTRSTPENGAHVTGFLRALTKIRKETVPDGMDHSTAIYGLTAVVSVFTEFPMYNSADTIRLMNPEMDILVYSTVYVGLCKFFRHDRERNRTLRGELISFVPFPHRVQGSGTD